MDTRQLKRMRNAIGSALVIVILLVPVVVGPTAVHAQEGNLLTNPGFEQPHGDGMSLSAPPGWSAWSNQTSGLVGRQLQRGTEVVSSVGVYEGNGSFDAYRGWSAYNVSIYQTVAVQPGSTLRLSAFGRIWSCDSDVDSPIDNCLTGDGSVVSQTAAGATFRVGIDPTGSNNPNAGTIVWSGTTAPYTSFQQMAVDATAQGDKVTVVLNAFMQAPARHQHVFWDSAVLAASTGGAAGAGGQTSAPAVAPPVAAQDANDDGSLIHTVQSGDTVAAIAYTYNITIPELLELNGMTMDDARFIYPGQELIVRLADDGSAPTADEPEASTEPAAEGTEGSAESTEAVDMPEVASAELGAKPIEEYEAAPVVGASLPMVRFSDAVSTGAVCTLIFDDNNPNRLREGGEGLLPGGQIMLTDAGAAVGTYTTDGENEPYCFDGLTPAEYTVLMVPPDGYGATTPTMYMLTVEAGKTVNAVFGASSGFVPPQPPSAQAVGGLFTDESAEEELPTEPLDLLMQYSGLIVLGLAGVVLVGGLGVTALLRR